MPSRRASALSVLVSALGVAWGTPSAASPEVQVRVHGSSRLEASASVSPQASQIVGSLRDDAGRPVPNARIRVRLVTDAGPRPIGRPQPCTGAVPRGSGGPSEAGDEALAETDEDGRFCLRWFGELPDGKLALAFEDDHRLLEASTLLVNLDREPPLEIGFAPPPRTLSLDMAEETVVVEARARAAPDSTSSPLSLAWVRVGGITTQLASGDIRPGEALRLSFPTRLLGAPGSGELVATTAFAGRPIETRSPLGVTARVTLETVSELQADSSGSARLSVLVRSVLGAVPSGSVEAISLGRTVGIASVVNGAAELALALPTDEPTATTSIRYLAATPWWISGAERRVVIRVPRPSPWRWLPWGIALASVAGWVLAAWQRPKHRDVARAKPPKPPVLEPTVEWLEAEPSASGWAGAVIDAHDGSPIANARIAIAWPRGKTLSATSNAAGRFDVPYDGLPDELGVIRVEAEMHAALERPLPPPGRLAVSLLTRRRALLTRLVDWVSQRGAPFATPHEPTPAELSEAARKLARADVASWAEAVENAAFGPAPIDAEREASIRGREPPR